jgi:diguanylate cyclase (GGDEF)-like protein
MPEQKILLVQDEKSPLLTLKSALAKNGFSVTTCSSGFDALDEMRCDPNDLVVSTVTLPDMNGFQLSSLIKSAEATSVVPVVVIGSHDELLDSFWKRASLSDLVFERKDVEFDEEKAIEKIKKLLLANVWDKQTLVETPLIPADLSGSDVVKSYRDIFASLLMERSISHLTRSLIDSVNSRVEFMARFFGYMQRLFDCEVTGLVVADQATPWGIFEISGSVSKAGFDKVVTTATKQLALGLAPRLVVNGDVADKGSTIKTSEVLPVHSISGEALGAVVLGWTTKHTLDEPMKTVAELLKTQMMPVFKALFDLQQIQLLRQQQAYSSSVDPITGLYNIEFLIGFLQQQLLFSQRQKLPVGLILVDIDRFLELNNQFGAEIGDLILAKLAEKMAANVRSSDLIARYSGDQFAVVLPNTDVAGSKVVADKLRSEVETMKWQKFGDKVPTVTVSVGCAAFNMEDVNPETLLLSAKKALQSAKEGGRNQVATI